MNIMKITISLLQEYNSDKTPIFSEETEITINNKTLYQYKIKIRR